MAYLSTEDVRKVYGGLMHLWTWEKEPTLFSKSALYDACVAMDQWQEDNRASANAALPEPFRSEATEAQKTLLFIGIAAMRAGIRFARTLLGGRLDRYG